MKDKKLEVGDKLYCIQYGGIQNIVTVDRTTPKMAFAGVHKFNLELENGKAKVIGDGEYSPIYYSLETQELKKMYIKSILLRKIALINFNFFTVQDLESILKILKINI